MFRKIKSWLGLSTSRVGRNTLFLLLSGLFLLYAIFQLFRKNQPGKAPKPTTVINEINSIIQAAGYSNRMASFWVGVSAFETADWTSNLFVNNYNLFGMKQPKTRETTSINPRSAQWAKFANTADSVRDLVLYLQNQNYPSDFPSLRSMLEYMKSKGYFEEDIDVYYNGVLNKI